MTPRPATSSHQVQLRVPPGTWQGALIFVLALAFAGCASSPVGQPSAGPTAGQVALLGATTAGGAALGNHFNDHYGAPIGAVAGLGAGLLANHYGNEQERRAYEEGYEQGRRDARVEVMRQYWYEKTASLASNPNLAGGVGGHAVAGQPQETSYNGGVVEGVRYTPRTTAQPGLTEPIRP